ncbi:MAG: hypothetical protein V4819_06610 [Verrucomicrobiota bacterium]
MRHLLTALALIAPAIAADVEEAPADGWQKIFALLPPGSELKGVMLPQYDENHKLTGVLKSEVVTLVDATRVAGRNLSIEFFKPDQTTKGRIDLVNATIYQDGRESGRIITRDPVDIKSDRVIAHGSGLYYCFGQNNEFQKQGFLLGPATTIILPAPKETTMNTPALPLRAMALAGLSLVSTAASSQAAAPPPITEAEIVAMHADARSNAAVLKEQAADTRDSLQKAVGDSESASQAATTFLVQNDLPAATPADEELKPADKPYDTKAAPGETVVKCEGGMYFDAEEGVLVYRKNVTVKDPRFDLSGINELKIFFSKKDPDAPKDGKDQAPKDSKDGKDASKDSGFGGMGDKMGDVEKIIATGAVRVKVVPKPGKDGKPKDPIEASGAIFSYNVKNDEAIISGGYPWFVHGLQRMRAMEPNLSMRLRDLNSTEKNPKDPKMNTEGHWEQFFNLEDMKAPGDKKR